MNTLKNKLLISYLMISLLIVIALSILFNLSLDKIFEQNAITQRKQQIDKIITQVNQQYLKETGLYNVDGLEVIGNAALQNGIMMHVQTVNKEIDWDIKLHKLQECQMLLQHLETNMHSRYPNFQGGYTEDNYDLKYKDEIVGYLTIGYYGPYSLSETELELINTLNRSLMALGTIFLLIASVLGTFMSICITNPISSVIKTAKKIAEGNYGTQTQESSNTKETADLIASINEMSEKLAYKEQQKKQITADVAHELRTPLCNLLGHMETMIDGVWEPTTERLQSCHVEILRIIQIVEQLKELNLLESKRNLLDRQNFEFSDLCNSLFKDFEVKARCKGIQLLVELPSRAPIYGDMNRLKQCMINLIQNAINYTSTGGTINIEYEKAECHVILRVSDTGAGIPNDDLPYVFERFYRVDKSRNHMSGGMGIGLSITKAIVDAHGGTISVKSQLGLGTTFIITLPNYSQNHNKNCDSTKNN